MVFRRSGTGSRYGYLYPSVIAAATGFEHVVREAGKIFKLNERTPLRMIIQQIGTVLGNHTLSDQLTSLTRLRNTLIHEQTSSRMNDADEARAIINFFEDGISTLDAALHRFFG